MNLNEKITENILQDPEISKSLDMIIKIAMDEYIKKIYILEGQLKDRNFELKEFTDENLSQKALIDNQNDEIRAFQQTNEELRAELSQFKLKSGKAAEDLMKQETDNERLNFKYQKQFETLSHSDEKIKENEKREESLLQGLKRKEIEFNNLNEDYIKIKEKVDRVESFANVKDRVAKQMQASFTLLNETIDKSKKSIRDKDVQIERLQRVVHEQQFRM